MTTLCHHGYAARPDFLLHEPAEVYHARRRDYLTSHQLADFRKCPQLYQQKKLGLIADDDRPAYLFGRAAHALILEGRDRFFADYAVGGPINKQTGKPFGKKTQAFADWAAIQGKPVIDDCDYALLSCLAASVHAHPIAASLLRQGVAEGVLRTNYAGLPCQARLDWLDLPSGITDLKTCDDLSYFEADARRFSYLHQLAFYRALLLQVTQVAFPAHFIAVEKKAPYRCGVWKIAPEALAAAQADNEAAMRRLRDCMTTDSWPTDYEDCRLFEAA